MEPSYITGEAGIGSAAGLVDAMDHKDWMKEFLHVGSRP